ncbi:DUF4955 domain-containing protein [Reichenbachiella sp.]|uniref:DUF4955 domain-containing protein n=1 Tax=Reichenbachiella sp. TaxID=2184521 RepID=UPI003B5A453B
MKRLVLFSIICSIGWVARTQTPQIWVDYQSDKANGITPELLDYSFAGYRYSEESIPAVDGWQQFSILDYGAVADDEGYDDDAIQAAIHAAEEFSGPAVVYFPPGKYLVSADNDVNKNIRVSRSQIVLKGAGAGAGGTEIFMDEKRVKNGHWQFVLEPDVSASAGNTFLAEPVEKGAFSVVFEDASGFAVGEVILLTHKSTAFAESHFEGLELNENDWTRLFGSGGGMSLHELHEIVAINGTRVTFKNPIQTNLPELDLPYTVSHYAVIEEVGIEGILFSSNWENYPEDFVHHKDDIHDYAWNAIQFENVQNAWLRNCEFKSWNQVVDVRESIGVTVENVLISGKKGHASFLTRRGYGLLVKDCDDQAGQHHGPGTGYSGVNTVYLRCQMQEDQSVDSHSGQPYATLLDDIDGGVMNKNGGPYESYPHHGRDLTFWNFIHKASDTQTYDFWNASSRNGNAYALPNFIGFQPNETVNKFDVGIDQMEGQRVSPASLFEAQLDLRMEAATTQPTLTWLSPNHGDQFDIGDDIAVSIEADDPDGSVEKVTLYFNENKQRELTSSPYQWGNAVEDDPELFDIEGGIYWLKIEVEDDDANVTVDSIQVFVGQAPSLEFVSPDKGVIQESGAPLIVEAEATDSDGSITAVTLYLGDLKLSELTTSPYVWDTESELQSLTSGNYVLTLEAIDNDGLLTTRELEIIVNEFPAMDFVSPTDEQEFEHGSNVTVTIDASDSDGSIAEILLYLNDELQRKEKSIPYLWGDRSDLDPEFFEMEAGTYFLEAVAVDDQGSESTIVTEFVVKPKEEVLSVNHHQNMVYPNPFSDQLTVHSSSGIDTILLTDLTGHPLMSMRANSQKTTMVIETSRLTRGIYLLQVIHNTTFRTVIEVVKN